MSKDYYQILGVNKNASKDEIKKSFKKLAHQHHPDKGGDQAKFSEINEAYQVLSNDKKRSQYDTYGHSFNGQGFNASGFDFNATDFGDIGDIFGSVFGTKKSRRRGRDINIEIEITFADAVYGIEKKLEVTKNNLCSECNGDRVQKGYKLKTCDKCNGKGTIVKTNSTILGTIQTSVSCDVCDGYGNLPEKNCARCAGLGVERSTQTLTLSIPGGIGDDSILKVTGKGEYIANGIPGNLYIRVHIVKDENWVVENDVNLVYNKEIKLTDAILGTEYVIQSPKGEDISIEIPKGVSDNDMLRLKKKGQYIKIGAYENVFVRLKINFPKSLSTKARELVEKLKDEGL